MDPTILTAMRESAERLLAEPFQLPELFATFENGDEAGWAQVTVNDEKPEGFEGLKLIVRTQSWPNNAMATCLLTTEFIRDDDTGELLWHALEMAREECRRTIAAA